MQLNSSKRAKRPRAQPHSPTHPSLLDRLLLAWVRSHLLPFRRLGPNLLSEVCTFLGHCPSILCQDEDRLYAFTPARGKWRSYSVSLPGLNRLKVVGAVKVGEQCWFLTTASLPEEYAYIVSSNKAEIVRVNWRAACGLLYYFSQNRIYLFGGLHLSAPTKDANSFALTSRSSQSLDCMHQSRSAFAPCWYGNVAYLIGGGSRFIETFHPVWGVFALLPDLMLPVGGHCNTVSVEDCIYILGKKLVTWRPETGEIRIQRGVRYRNPSACAVACEGYLFLPLKGLHYFPKPQFIEILLIPRVQIDAVKPIVAQEHIDLAPHHNSAHCPDRNIMHIVRLTLLSYQLPTC